MNKKLIAVAIAIIIIVAAVAVVWHYTSANDDDTEWAFIIEDDLGRKVPFEKSPERVMSLGSSFTESMIYLDCLENIACVDKGSVTRLQSIYPEVADIDRVESGKPNTNTIDYCVTHGIDLVIVWGYYPDQIAQLESAGITVIGLYPKTIEDVQHVIALLGTIMSKEEKAESILSTMDTKISYITQNAKEKAGEQYGSYSRVYIELDTLSSGNYNSPNSNSITGTMLDILGVDYIGKNADKTQYYQTESIIEYAPDYLIFMGPRNQSELDILRNGMLDPESNGWGNPDTVLSIYTSESEPGFNGNWASATPSLIDGLEYLYDLIYK